MCTEFPLVSPIEYVVKQGKKPLAYVPIIPMLQKLLSKSDVLDKPMSEKVQIPKEYSSYADWCKCEKYSCVCCS